MIQIRAAKHYVTYISWVYIIFDFIIDDTEMVNMNLQLPCDLQFVFSVELSQWIGLCMLMSFQCQFPQQCLQDQILFRFFYFGKFVFTFSICISFIFILY
jgi:hypothetical protein